MRSEYDTTDHPMLGNLCRNTVCPPNYSGPTRKGHLIFDANFESGNLGRVDYLSEYEYDLFIRPDTCNSRYRVWFNFTVENTKLDQRVIFNIVNFSKTKSLYREGMSPFVKSTSRCQWVRLPPKNVFYYRCPDHSMNYVMSFVFCFDNDSDTYQFCYCYPYTYSDLQNYLDKIERCALDFFDRQLLCVTLQKRRIDLLTITHPNNLDKEGVKVIFITARIHPGETPSSLVCQGIIDYLISSDPAAILLRETLVFKIIPMLNPDGVYLGNYRCSLMGYDLNRHWTEPSSLTHPSLFQIKSYLVTLDSDKKYDLEFYIDIHAHSTLTNSFMYGNTYDDYVRYNKHIVFPQLLAGLADDFSLEKTNFNRDAVKAGTGRRTLGNCLGESTHCYTLEVSFFSYMVSSSPSVTVPYTQETYMKLGCNIARTFLEYYKLSGFISTQILSHPHYPVERSETGNQHPTY